jgi:hypothetical protein
VTARINYQDHFHYVCRRHWYSNRDSRSIAIANNNINIDKDAKIYSEGNINLMAGCDGSTAPTPNI